MEKPPDKLITTVTFTNAEEIKALWNIHMDKDRPAPLGQVVRNVARMGLKSMGHLKRVNH